MAKERFLSSLSTTGIQRISCYNVIDFLCRTRGEQNLIMESALSSFPILAVGNRERFEVRDNASTFCVRLFYRRLQLHNFVQERTKQSLLHTFRKLKETSAQYGLIANGQKTKYLRCTRKNYKLEIRN